MTTLDRRTLRWAAVVPLLLLASCAHKDTRVEISVTTKLTLCRAAHCVFVPAAGAHVSVLTGSQVAGTATANGAGKVVFRKLPPGRYTATAVMPELALTVTSPPLDVGPGGAADIDANFQPPLQVKAVSQ